MAVIPNDVRGRRNLPVGSQASSALQQGRRKRLTERRHTPEQCTNVSTPRPSSSSLAREHHELSPALFTCQFGIRAFFRVAGLVQGGSVRFYALPPGGSVSSHCADHRSAHGKLCAVEERQTVAIGPLCGGTRALSVGSNRGHTVVPKNPSSISVAAKDSSCG